MPDTPGPHTLAEALELLDQRDADLRRATDELEEARQAEARLAAVLQSSSDAIISMTPDGVIQTWNPGAHKLLGHPAQEIVGKPLQSLMPAESQQMFSRDLAQLRQRGHAKPYNTRWASRAGTPIDVGVNITAVRDSSGDVIGLLAVVHDITARLQAERQIDQMARFDGLTGLASRAEAMASLEAALRRPRIPGPHLGVLHCDIDHLKTVNDTLGLDAGNVVLATLAERIRAKVRGGDTVARIGGDEMLVALPNIHSLDNLAQIAEKIRCLAAEPIPYKRGKTIQVTISIGATVAAADESVQTLMLRAQSALKKAKEAGHDTVTCI